MLKGFLASLDASKFERLSSGFIFTKVDSGADDESRVFASRMGGVRSPGI